MISILPLTGMGEVEPGADLASLLLDAMARGVAGPGDGFRGGDLLAVTQKIVSKAEARFVDLADVRPGAEARALAEKVGKDPRFVELVLRESDAIVRAAPGVLIARHRLGFVMANAGIDRSNLGPSPGIAGGERVLLLPENPDASAARLRDEIARRAGVRVGVLITDSFGRPWRQGVVNVAIGAAGIASLLDRRGEPDRDGGPLAVTQAALGDAIAAAAGLATGDAAEGVPAALIRGLDVHEARANPASALIRPLAEDLFQ